LKVTHAKPRGSNKPTAASARPVSPAERTAAKESVPMKAKALVAPGETAVAVVASPPPAPRGNPPPLPAPIASFNF
jgi:hypothetical protein